ncbi:metallophosphoesterase [Bradyrhizobium hipponense]|uniref:Metallophosphoesterase n=1 Tax=Bradyrhizobium hipponense TaxID=2605638 RepID=A0A5S4YBS8_9BRAD|nr:metallophosphoesterase [Bradyrhizobium hipponense]TYO61473.1 metallophosphoesterase [Bradyrhizobium hipponense]
MRLWVLSDLHVELTRGWDLPAGDARPQFDVLVVAGDLIPRAERGVKWLQERVPDKPIVYIPGNHEAYGTDIDRTVEKAKVAAAGTNIHVLRHDSLQIGNVTFAGATLWTDFNLFGDQHRAMVVATERMNDFRKIRINRYLERFRPGHALARHLQARAFLDAEMRRPRGGPLVVVTHHAPIPSRARRLGPYDFGAQLSDEEVLTAYRSALTSLMWPAPVANGKPQLRPADLWIYGHTHESEDTVIGATRVVSNATGYGPRLPQQRTWDNPRFNPNFVIET